MKVRITKGTMKAYLTNNIFHFSEMPDFIELEGEPVDEILVTCCIRCKYTGCSNIGCKCHSKSTWVSNEDIDKAAAQLTPSPCGVPEKLEFPYQGIKTLDEAAYIISDLVSTLNDVISYLE